MSELEQLVDSLLFEGYALYPYTPGATKNATPTPFGIVYPAAYATALTSTYDHLELSSVLEAGGTARVHAEVRFLAASGGGHRAAALRLELPPVSVDELAGAPALCDRSFPREEGSELAVRLRLTAKRVAAGLSEISLRVENRSPCDPAADRRQALRHSLLSTHPLLRVEGGRFVSPLDRPCASVNTFPILATIADDAVLGAAIVLPDHPRIAPESRGSLFDATEIEEALLLHVQALSDGERDEIAKADPAIREMLERAAAVTPRELAALHGRVTLRDPETTSPPQAPPWLEDPSAGEESAEVEGTVYRRGGRVRIQPGADADLQARMLSGRSATIERIFIDDANRVHLGVTIDGDPGQDLLRETNRLLFFFVPEVEVLDA
jgi:hypothetical protein